VRLNSSHRLLNSAVHKRQNYDQIRTVVSIDLGMDQVYPDVNSKDREKAKIALAILQTLAKELDESLFLSIDN